MTDKKTPPHLALKGIRRPDGTALQRRIDDATKRLYPEQVQVYAQLMQTLQQLNVAQGQTGPGKSATFIEPKPERVLVAKYGLSRKQVIAAGGALAPYADKMVAELTSHQLAGREVVQTFDAKRDVWVYEVFEMQDVVPREAGGESNAKG